MASLNKFFPQLLKDEGGYVNHPQDKGGATNLGVTLRVWKSMGYDKNGDNVINEKDIRLLTPEDAKLVFRAGYWNRWLADQIKNQSVAEFLTDWVYTSGVHGIKEPQRVLNEMTGAGMPVDGVVGPRTLKLVNSVDQKSFFEALKLRRLDFSERIVKNDPGQVVFLKGWKNRINRFKFSPT
jgi:lysozyme family protein